MSIREWFRGTDDERVLIARVGELEGSKSEKRRDEKTLKEGSALRSRFRNRTLGAIGGGAFLIAGAAAAVVSSNTEKDQPALNSTATASRTMPEGLQEKYLPEAEIRSTNRAELRDRWINPMKEVTDRSTNPIARMVQEFVLNSAILAEPNGQGVRALEAAKNPNNGWFILVPIVRQDTTMPLWEKPYTAAIAGNFKPQDKSLILKADMPMSPQWRGIIIAHEGFHAFEYIPKPYDWHNPEIFVQHERAAHEFENSLIASEGGSKYQDYLETEIERIHVIIASHGPGAFETYFPDRAPYDTKLDTIFGAAESKFEKDTRMTHIWIHAIFSIIEEDFPAENRNIIKENFLTQLYKKQKFLPH